MPDSGHFQVLCKTFGLSQSCFWSDRATFFVWFFWSGESSYVGDRWWYWSKLMIWKMTFGLHAIYWQEHQYKSCAPFKSLMLVQASFYTCLHLSLKGSICFQHHLHPQLGKKKFFYLCRRFKASTKICLQTKWQMTKVAELWRKYKSWWSILPMHWLQAGFRPNFNSFYQFT